MRAQAPLALLGDTAYAQVNSAWLHTWYASFRAELRRLGVAHWDGRFDCNRFAEIYSGLAQVSFLRATEAQATPARALALGPFWYVRADGEAHAIVQALTERGRVFIDPQTGEEVALTTGERKSAYFQAF